MFLAFAIHHMEFFYWILQQFEAFILSKCYSIPELFFALTARNQSLRVKSVFGLNKIASIMEYVLDDMR